MCYIQKTWTKLLSNKTAEVPTAYSFAYSSGRGCACCGDMGEMPLHGTVAKQDAVMVELLLCQGAKDDVVSEFGDTPREQILKKGGPTWEAIAKAARRSRRYFI